MRGDSDNERSRGAWESIKDIGAKDAIQYSEIRIRLPKMTVNMDL